MAIPEYMYTVNVTSIGLLTSSDVKGSKKETHPITLFQPSYLPAIEGMRATLTRDQSQLVQRSDVFVKGKFGCYERDVSLVEMGRGLEKIFAYK